MATHQYQPPETHRVRNRYLRIGTGAAVLAGAAMTVPNYTYPYHLGLQRVRFIVDAALRVGVLVSRRGRFRRG
jgi:hypothetical protein